VPNQNKSASAIGVYFAQALDMTQITRIYSQRWKVLQPEARNDLTGFAYNNGAAGVTITG